MAEKLRLALLGCGRIAQVHWNGIEESAAELIHVTACIDIHLPRAESMAAKLREATGEPCSAFTSLAEALSGDVEIDAVDIMLLHNQHEAAALEAFEAGLHVIMESECSARSARVSAQLSDERCCTEPMAITPESCGRVMRAAAATDKAFWIAEQEQYAPAILTAQRLIAEGAIGDTVTLHTMTANAGGPGMFGANAVGKPPPAIGSAADSDGKDVKMDSLGRDSVGQEQVVKSAGLPDYYMPMEGEESFRTDKLDRAWRTDKSIAGGASDGPSAPAAPTSHSLPINRDAGGVVLDGGSHTIRPMRMLMQPHCGNIVAVAGVIEALDEQQEGENFTRTLMRFENGQTATLEMGGVPGAVYGESLETIAWSFAQQIYLVSGS